VRGVAPQGTTVESQQCLLCAVILVTAAGTAPALAFSALGSAGKLPFFWSVAQFVEWWFGRAGWDGRVVSAATCTAARYGHATRYGPTARCGHSSRPIAIRVRPRNYVAERRGHFLNAEDTGRWGLRRC
jgi:hypothetical protein